MSCDLCEHCARLHSENARLSSENDRLFDAIGNAMDMRAELQNQTKKESTLDKAKRVMRQLLAGGAVASVDLEEKLAKAGVSAATATRARKQIGAEAVRELGIWYVRMPSLVDQ